MFDLGLKTVELLPKKSHFYRLFSIEFADGTKIQSRVLRIVYRLGGFALVFDND